MEYERIHKVQTGLISPSKLRMKLIGSQHQKKKSGSNNNSSRTSPSRLEYDSEFVENSLLSSPTQHSTDEASSSKVVSIKSDSATSEVTSQSDANSLQSIDNNGDVTRIRTHLFSKSDSAAGSSSVHPVRTNEDDNLDYDSTSSFEFHKGERPLHHHTITRSSSSRPMPSKWNDAEKWIMNRQNVQPNITKKPNVHNQAENRPLAAGSMVRVVPEPTGSENKSSVKRVDFYHPASSLNDLFHGVKDLMVVDDKTTKSGTDETTGVHAIRSVSMRDTGTEMTPIPSQEPSRSATPVSSTTPLRSPTSSIPSTPRRGDPAPIIPTEQLPIISNSIEKGKNELSEQELKLKTRKEIVALGVRLGKMNVAAWASMDEREKGISGNGNAEGEDVERVEYAKRASAWEEAEKSKHAARFKREEIRIQAWESRQKARVEAEMRKIEAQIEQMRAQAQAMMVKKIALARQKSEDKRVEAEARKKRQAEKSAAQAEYIRQTGRIPSSPFHCCGWL